VIVWMHSLQRIFWQWGRTCRNSQLAKVAMVLALSAPACAQASEHPAVRLLSRTPFTTPSDPPTGIPVAGNGRLLIVTSQILEK
jgi:hypothetical protein